MTSIEIGGLVVGCGHPPVLLADLDVYFKNDLESAFALVDVVARAGCRFLKGAVLTDVDLCLESDLAVTYFDASTGVRVEEKYRDVISRHVVSEAVLATILGRAREKGMAPILSVYDERGVAFAVEQQAVALKIPSSNITHAPLIAEAAKADLPILLDTGRSTLAEIDRAVGWAMEAGAAGRLVVEHSPPGPPAGPERAHLRMIPFLAERYGCPVGLSDHGLGLDALPVAVALGASIVEKGIVTDETPPDIDVAHAMRASAVAEANRLIQDAWLSLGTAPRPEDELPSESRDRMGLVARRTLLPGDRLDKASVRFAFPPEGIGVEHWSAVQNATVTRRIAAGAPIPWAAVATRLTP